MTESEHDRDLARDFEALRSRVEDSGAVPDFTAMMARARADAAGPGQDARAVGQPGAGRTIGRGRWMPWAPLAAAAAAAGVLLLGRPGTSADAQFERLVADYTSTIAATARQSPTASLMRIPGIDLGAVPSFGGYSSGTLTPDGVQERNR